MGPTILPIKLVFEILLLKGQKLDVKLTTYLHLVSRLIIRGSMPLLPYMPAGLGQEYLYLLYLYQHQTPLELQGNCCCVSRRDLFSWSHVVRRSFRTVSISQDPVLNEVTQLIPSLTHPNALRTSQLQNEDIKTP